MVLRVLAAVAVACACIYFVRRLDLQAVRRALAGASVPLIVLAAVTNLFVVLLRAVCWRVMLSPIAGIPVARMFRYHLASFAVSNLLPARSGDLVRILLIHMREGIAASTGLAVSLVEKAFEAIAMLLLALPLPLLLPELPRWVSVSIGVLAAVGLVAVGLVWLVARAGPDGEGRLARFSDGARLVAAPRRFGVVLGLIVAVWLCDGVSVLLVLRAVHVEIHWAAPLVVLLVLNMAIMVPAAPANLGSFEIGVVAALGLLGVEREQALGVAIAYHAVQVVPVTLLGLDGLRFLGRAESLRREVDATRS